MEKLLLEVRFFNNTNTLYSHRHNCHQIIYIKKGNVELDIENKHYQVTDNSVIFINNFETHNINIHGSVYDRYYINISPPAADLSIKDKKLLSIFFSHRSTFQHVIPVDDIATDIQKIFHKIYTESLTAKPYQNEMNILLINELLILLFRFSPDSFPSIDMGAADIVWGAKGYIEQNFKQVISLATIAKHYHLSIYYLSHIFKKITGYTLKQYILQCRLNYAKELLCLTNLSIIEIAIEAGFSDHSNFSRYFKREVGCTPSEYKSSKKSLLS